jgi:uncharacterized membrane protein
MIIAIHTVLGVLALITGAWNLIQPKGTSQHRRVGRIYAGSMIALIATSFFIYEIFTAFGPFHILALVSGGTLALALYFPLRRDHHENWIEHHYFWITYSYVGLVMATGSHLFEVVPDWPWAVRAVLFWGVPYVVGSVWIFGRRHALIERMQRRFQ